MYECRGGRPDIIIGVDKEGSLVFVRFRFEIDEDDDDDGSGSNGLVD